MKVFLLTAPRQLTPRIPQGFFLQVVSAQSGNRPDVQEVKQAMIRTGLTDPVDLGWSGPGNWNITELK